MTSLEDAKAKLLLKFLQLPEAEELIRIFVSIDENKRRNEILEYAKAMLEKAKMNRLH